MMLPEWKYNQLARFKMVSSKITAKLLKKPRINLLENRLEVFSSMIRIVNDAIEFYGLTREEFIQNITKWEETELALFNKAETLKEFYESWNDEASIQNVCANIVNQLIWFENYNVCCEFTSKAEKVIDYGCGTGSLSLSLALNKKIKKELVLLDVPNDVSKFRDHIIKKHGLQNVSNGNILEYKTKKQADLIMCLDVLEHLEESSSIFINQLSPLLKRGGLAILRAPWRGQLTHIDQAANDFYLNGGRKFLAKNYEEVYRFGNYDICAVYRKL